MKYLLIIISFFFLTSTTTAYSSQNRIALVIGNGDYKDAPLRNPVNDARTLSWLLSKAGFSVKTLENVNRRELVDAMRTFGSKLRKSEVALFYFSGHGIQHEGRNWLIPIGADINREKDIEFEGLNAERILYEMEGGSSGRVNILIFDACRTNPSFSSFRSLNRGFAYPRVQPEGSIVAFSTAPGTVAYDGDGTNSPYVAELKKHMLNPGLKIEEVFKRVRIGVKKRTLTKPSPQIPWENSSLMGDFYFLPPLTDNTISSTSYQTANSTQPTNYRADETVWKDIENSIDIQDFRFFLDTFPYSSLANVARFKLKRLEKEKRKLLDANKVRTGTLYLKDLDKNLEGEHDWFENIKGNFFAKYVGMIQFGKPNGNGTLTWAAGKYKGKFVNGLFNGYGIETYKNGGSYEGIWKDDKKNGTGRYTFPDGANYSGQWINNEPNGKGTMNYSNFDWYSGGWKDGKYHGYGTIYYKSGEFSGFSYKGYWKNGKAWKGFYTNQYGKIYSEVKNGIIVR
jgi:hypothetical protein